MIVSLCNCMILLLCYLCKVILEFALSCKSLFWVTCLNGYIMINTMVASNLLMWVYAFTYISKYLTFFNPVSIPCTDEEISKLPHFSRSQLVLTMFLGSGAFGEVFEGLAKNIVMGDGETRCAVKVSNSCIFCTST